MVLQSGTPPYVYDYGGGPFQTPKPSCDGLVIGPSGKLLEQAQFTITAELRRWFGGFRAHELSDFFVYTHPDIAPSGPYEPKANGSTLGNTLNPGSMFTVDHIIETRDALSFMLGKMRNDTDYTSDQLLASWLNALYPNNPSGAAGHYSRRSPSEVGSIDYIAEDVLGSSGVLYDIDFGEVMYNPFPHIAKVQLGNVHGKGPAGNNSVFTIRMAPLFPSFQKTNGTLIGLNGREPADSELSNSLISYDTSHISSNLVRCDGYMLTSDSEYYLGDHVNVFDRIEDFSFALDSPRTPPGGLAVDNVPTSRVFLSTTAQASGVYMLAVRNPLSSFPNAAIESGVTSRWPNPSRYWPVESSLGDTTSNSNLGYEVFDDAIWRTDNALDTFSAEARYPSGLAIMSPYTGHNMWVRFADLTASTLDAFDRRFNWTRFRGLENINGSIIRVNPNPAFVENGGMFISASSGRAIFVEYNADLDLISETRSTSVLTNGPNNYFPTAGQADMTFSDLHYDGTHYWVWNNEHVGYDVWKFDNNFEFVDKYSNFRDSWVTVPLHGLRRTKAAYVNGQNRIFAATSGLNTAPISKSGIFPYTVAASPDGPGESTQGDLFLGQRKDIDGASVAGHQPNGEILDLIEVTNGTHVPNGVWALVRWEGGDVSDNSGQIFLLLIEERPNKWEVMAHFLIDDSTNTPDGQIIHMDL